MGIKDALIQRFAGMVLSYLKEELPRLKRELCEYSDEYARRTDNEWDDMGAELLRAFLGVPKGE